MDWSSITAIAVAAITGFAGWAGSRLTARSQERATLLEHSGPNWRAFMGEVKDWTNQELEKRDREITQLRSEVDTLRGKIDELKSKYFSAVQHIRDWRSTHPESIPDLPLPDAIKQEF